MLSEINLTQDTRAVGISSSVKDPIGVSSKHWVCNSLEKGVLWGYCLKIPGERKAGVLDFYSTVFIGMNSRVQ